ncbi:iron chelate uptake ABC transporter family permease subunit, partial [Streptomyces sp. A73]|nr:iron chelate uptake ABC transporter family permease subunit [Streptomyces sp. A73]
MTAPPRARAAGGAAKSTGASAAGPSAAVSGAAGSGGPASSVAAPGAPPRTRRGAATTVTAALVAALLLLALLSAGIGAYTIPVSDVLGSLLHRAGAGGAPLDRVAESVLWNVRLPRVVLAVLVGASLGCAGALMQGVFGNPLAEPGVIGISSGAAVGAVASIALGLTFLGNWTVTA